VNDATQEAYCEKTIRRDLDELEELGFLFCVESARTNVKGRSSKCWFINLKRSRVLEELAIEINTATVGSSSRRIRKKDAG
jgi:hypothetical protein